MIERIIGVITLKSPVYRAIADDQSGTSQAALVFIISTVIMGFFNSLFKVTSDGTTQLNLIGAIIGAIFGLVIGLVGWVFTAWVLSFVAKLMDGKTSTSEMLRVTGFVQVFNLASVLNILLFIPGVGCITGLVTFAAAIFRLVGYVIGVREAAEFTTGKAIITGITAIIVNLVVVVVIGGAILGLILAAVSIAS
jgi:hypothetical protein